MVGFGWLQAIQARRMRLHPWLVPGPFSHAQYLDVWLQVLDHVPEGYFDLTQQLVRLNAELHGNLSGDHNEPEYLQTCAHNLRIQSAGLGKGCRVCVTLQTASVALALRGGTAKMQLVLCLPEQVRNRICDRMVVLPAPQADRPNPV